jgi:hypothetical protein
MMTRLLLWLGKRMALLSLVVGGGALALFAYSRIGKTAITPGLNFGKYTYSSSDCHEPDASAEDPINVVFYNEAPKAWLDYYFNLYHGWGDNDGETQYFKTNGLCHVMDGQPSSRKMGFTRYHARYSRGRTSSGGVDYDPTWGDYSVAAAHYELWAMGGDCGLGNHVVPENGFNEGRDNVINNWVNEPSPGHFFAGLMDWGNTLLREQCNHTWAGSDGRVAFIKAYLDTDGDGCQNAQEVPPGTGPSTPGAKGGFNPNNYWDFYDVPTPAYPDPRPNGPRNRAINVQDVTGVIKYVGACSNCPPSHGVDYDSLKDGDWNGDGVVNSDDKVGRRYDRSPGALPNPPYEAGPPDGAINIQDVVVVLRQVTLDCRSGTSGAGADFGGDGGGGALDSPPNAMAVDAIPGGAIDTWRWWLGGSPFDMDVVASAAAAPYAGYGLALSYDHQVLEFVPTADLDGDTVLESWTYSGLGGMGLNATVGRTDLDGDTVADAPAGGSARSSGTTTATGVVVTARFRCVGNGTSAVHLVTTGESVFGTTTIDDNAAVIDTSLADANVSCFGVP